MTPSEARELLPEEFSEVPEETIENLVDLIVNVCKYEIHENLVPHLDSSDENN